MARARKKKLTEEDKERKKREYQKKYYIQNKEKRKRYLEKNRERIRKYNREYSRKNRERRYENRRKYGKRHREELRQHARRYQKHLLKTWRRLFRKMYGEHPICEICGKELSWNTNSRSVKVHFDHRHGEGRVIKISPGTWLGHHSCTREAWRVWKAEGFGILCFRCNCFFPTDPRKRKKLIQSIIHYAAGSKQVQLEQLRQVHYRTLFK